MYVHELLESDDHSSYQETISTWKGGGTPTYSKDLGTYWGWVYKGRKMPYMFAEYIGIKAR